MARHLQDIQNLGFDVEAVDDFTAVKQRVRSTGRNRVNPMMDVDRLDFTRKSAFWIFLQKDGVDIGSAGVKCEDLDDESFESYIRRTSRSQYAGSADLIEAVAPPLSSALAGKLIYIGELEFSSGAKGRRGLLPAFVGYLKALSALKWSDFDWMYAFIPEEHVSLARHYEFSFHVPRAVTWKSPPPPGRLDSHYVIGLDRASYRHAIRSKEEAERRQG
ncbi:hypothetical protein [Leisingera sp. M523]|uniref:hypothetical protein n=1 Tax=Leisingera sp. M523 TaxID=2867013 RepID=UPI0021A887E2|nr:hypothetical protein [Leisingera sp. M523]UWQ30222.1 hypothetical protein K3557_06715 [Leisingera sp. M523]